MGPLQNMDKAYWGFYLHQWEGTPCWARGITYNYDFAGVEAGIYCTVDRDWELAPILPGKTWINFNVLIS